MLICAGLVLISLNALAPLPDQGLLAPTPMTMATPASLPEVPQPAAEALHQPSPIIGIALNGANGTKAVAATDGGLLDGDKVWEHAVGPFQFIPSAWAVWRADAHGDGFTDPQNIDNAALAAAKYLCADNRDLSSGEDWLRAILSYNNSVDYARQVYGLARQRLRVAPDSGPRRHCRSPDQYRDAGR